MKVWLAEHSGFCFGVRRAIKMAREAKAAGGEVFTLGELIHNPRIVKELASEGVGSVNSAAEVTGKKVVLRSHGVSKQDLEALAAGNNEIIDATCPYVERAQQLVASQTGIPVLILGDPEHPEVRGMLSYGNSHARVVRPGEDPGEESWKTLCIVCQTTQKLANLEFLVRKVLPRCQELIVFNTICSATTQRQEAAVALAKVVDLMIVIGGRNSSNTKALHELCSRETRSLFVEEASGLASSDLGTAETIGLAAGASTPEEAIWEVFTKIHAIKGIPAAASRFEEIPRYKEESC
ncbi:MAG: 4-hydroxy-3-methylbut-2-enyl diphosphate reductase [Candidatus Cloacimonadaceae bacterium]